jgi:hypothetical protein
VCDVPAATTFALPPVAIIDPHEAVAPGTLVTLNGGNSFDPDQNYPLMNYRWKITNLPPLPPGQPLPKEEAKEERDPLSFSFTPTMDGDYRVMLVVTDSMGIASQPVWTTVNVNTNNPPVADARPGSPIIVGGRTGVQLDGSQSYDPDGNDITYQWSCFSWPGSNASPPTPAPQLDGANTATPTVWTDVYGDYTLQLVVSDGRLSSDPNNTTVTFLTKQDAASDNLTGTVEVVTSIPPSQAAAVFVNTNMQNALTNKINEALKLIDQKKYSQALNKLQNDILPKTNGCHDSGAPDANDWIKDCATQQQVYPFVVQTIELLQGLQ